MDKTLFQGIVVGSLATLVLCTIVLAAGTEPRSANPRHDCVCPDSTKIESPRGLSAH